MVKQKLFEFKRIDTDGELFQPAIDFTLEITGFNSALIEKDYFCSLILAYLYSAGGPNLIFKGGTALNKIYAGFYRLSEDLDFSIAMPLHSTRGERRKAINPFKELFEALPNVIPGIEISVLLTGRNESFQYIGELKYPSCLDIRRSTMQIEIIPRAGRAKTDSSREQDVCPS